MRGQNMGFYMYQRGGSNEGSQNGFLWRNKENLSLNYPCYPLLSEALIRPNKHSVW